MNIQCVTSWRCAPCSLVFRLAGIIGLALGMAGGVRVAPAQDISTALPQTRPMAHVSPTENWNVDYQGSKDAGDKEHRVLALEPSANEKITSLNPQLDAQRLSKNPTRFILDASLESGENVGVSICLIDAEGEEFGLKNTSLKPGANKIVWRIPEDVGGHWGAKGNGRPDGEVRVSRILVLRWPSPSQARLRLNGLEVSERESPIDHIKTTFDPGNARTCVIKQYSITGMNHTNEWHDPAAWKLQGSNNKEKWTDLDTRSGQTFEHRKQTKTFDIANEQTFSHYRMVVTAAAKPSGAVGIAELRLMTRDSAGKLVLITDSGSSWSNDDKRPYAEPFRAFDNSSGSSWIGSLAAEGAILGYDPTTTPVPFVKPNQADQAALVLHNDNKAPIKVKLVFRALDSDDNEVKREISAELPAQGNQTVHLPKDLATRFGVLRLKWEVVDALGGKISGENRLAVMEPAGPETSHRKYFLFGNGGCEQPGLLSQIGIDVVRMSDEWCYGADPDGKYDWSDYDRQIEQAERYGLMKQWLMTYTPGWGIRKDFIKPTGEWYGGGAPIEPEAFRMYAHDLATRYKGRIDFYETRNEVDLNTYWRGTTDQYLEIQKISFEEIRKADPQAKVLTSGFATLTDHGGRHLNPTIMERTVKEAQDSFDYLAFHQHGDFFGVFQPVVDGELASICKSLKSPKPLFYTETSVCSDRNWQSQVGQGDELIKKVVFAWARGAYAYEWFSALDWKNSEMWGLCTWDFQAKPAYLAYNTLIKTLRGLTPQRQLKLGPDQWAFVFADPEGKSNRQVVVCWRENSRLPDADVRLVIGEKATCKRMDQYGNHVDEPVIGGQVRAALRNHPVYFVVEGGEAITQALPLVVPGSVAAFDTGSTLHLVAEVGNPADRERTLRINWQMPPEFKGVAVVPEQTVKLAAGAKQQVAVDVPIPADLSMPSFGSLLVGLHYAVDGVESWQGKLVLPLQLTRTISDGDFAKRKADFTLETGESVVNFFAADPGNTDKIWKGPADLSAKAWLGRTKDTLVFRCEVSDDVQDQPFLGGDSWKGDGIQVAFAIPGQKGNWELCLYQTNDQTTRVHLFAMPADTALANPWDKTPLKITRQNGKMIYEASFPYALYGITDDILTAKGIRFNFIVNDSDGKGIRNGFIRLAAGIGEGKSTEKFPVIRFKTR